VKYYLYISDAKVDMLLPQIPHETKKKIATEFGFDFKIFKAGRKSEEDPEDNRITRLEAVVAFLREYGNLGSIDEPDEFIEGSAVMAMQSDQEIVLFTGVGERTTVCLGGSSRHLLGNPPVADGSRMTSMAGGIYQWLEENEKDRDALHGFSPAWSISWLAEKSMKDSIIPKQPVEFVAKRLLFEPNPRPEAADGSDSPSHVLLATPLYVAMTD
jgi:hypothetical protein